MKIVKIGRDAGNDIIIDDRTVSRIHCQIIQDDNDNFRLIDINSSNGTFVNGTKRHGEVRLYKSDIVRIGNTTLPWQAYFYNVGERNNSGGAIAAPESGYNPPTQKPDSFLVWAILGTMFCCLPFGIVSIVYASKVDGLWHAGNYGEAKDAARKARTWFWWSFGIGLACSLFWLLYYIIVGIAIGIS